LIAPTGTNEVDSAHPLMRKLDAVRQAGAAVQEIVLAPLAREDLEQMIGDSIRWSRSALPHWDNWCHEKTAGNHSLPFSPVSLAEKGCSISRARMVWDLKRIQPRLHPITSSTHGRKLNRLRSTLRNYCKQLACLGNSADFALLTMVYEGSEDEMHSDSAKRSALGSFSIRKLPIIPA